MPRQLLRECIEVATQAPAGGNVQRWRWVVVDDPELKLGLAELYRRAYEPYIAQQRELVAEVGRSVAGIISSSDHLAEMLQDVPVLVVPCGLDRVPADGGGGTAQGYYGSLLPAVWSFMLAARSASARARRGRRCTSATSARPASCSASPTPSPSSP